MKRGISPVIAIVVLMLMTVSAAGMAAETQGDTFPLHFTLNLIPPCRGVRL